MDYTFVQNSYFHGRPNHNLTNEQRKEIFQALLLRTVDGKLTRGCVPEVAAMFSVSNKTIHRIWSRAKACEAHGSKVDVSSKKRRRVGRKRREIDWNKVRGIAFHRRTNIRSFSEALEVPKSTLHQPIKEGEIRPHTNPLKPNLSDQNKIARLHFCLSMLEPNSLQTQPMFKAMYNYVHIDEKWFYMTKESERYYVLPDEDQPHRTCKSKRFITKVMFLAAVARPRFGANGCEEFSGKIGIFPFTVKEPAKRTSKNRLAGTIETKAVAAVTKDVIRLYLIEKVIPAIQSKWPQSSVGETIYIQQDNARPHIKPNDVEFHEAAPRNGFDIRLTNQPANSPDLNVLDLGFFNAIQSLQHQEAPRTIDQLVNAVEKSFDKLPSRELDSVFLSLQACMVEVMKVNGGNNYKLPHIKKPQLRRDGVLPFQLECGRDVMENVLIHLQNQAN
ncbi:hypothetical protein RHSIM_Rhsim05G0119600 [Rhododendron simsii]|uniref:DUF7769 domain-containing protein n=1 Tax=Rhododendron simsii TaxID=118357 RepID=A0A834GVI2_RHOSS|nr:hypothetical protein RHSIM_Rhsim05G0119600 [Rhododendron simsii]